MTTMREREQVPTLGDDELKGLVALKEKFAKKPRHLDRYVWGALRIGIGRIFLWGFLDKLFGFGFATAKESAWINGGSPKFGFLSSAPPVLSAGSTRAWQPTKRSSGCSC